MNAYPAVVRHVIDRIKKLPGFGEKSATRLTLHFVQATQREVEELTTALLAMKRNLSLCPRCFHLADVGALCGICADPSRSPHELCVVETTSDLIAIEQTGAYKGLYHVLHGVLNPLENIGTTEIRLGELFRRIEAEPIHEVIIATNPTAHGEATAHYILEHLQHSRVKMTRIGFGIPVGGDIKYSDTVTLIRALRGRQPFEKEGGAR